MTISLGPRSLAASSGLPNLPLHRIGVCPGAGRPAAAWALTPRFHPYPAARVRRYVSVASHASVAALMGNPPKRARTDMKDEKAQAPASHVLPWAWGIAPTSRIPRRGAIPCSRLPLATISEPGLSPGNGVRTFLRRPVLGRRRSPDSLKDRGKIPLYPLKVKKRPLPEPTRRLSRSGYGGKKSRNRERISRLGRCPGRRRVDERTRR